MLNPFMQFMLKSAMAPLVAALRMIHLLGLYYELKSETFQNITMLKVELA